METMLIAGVVILMLGLILGLSFLWTLGVILAIVGAAFWVHRSAGRTIPGRRHYW